MIKRFIKGCPDIVKNPIENIYGKIPDNYKYGQIFRKKYKFLKKSQFWSEEKLKEHQLKEIKKLIEHAYNTVPYYKNLFDSNNIKIEDIQSLEDIKKIPYLTKEIIKNNLEELISNKFNKNEIEYVTTGGSTGTPMGFYVDKKKYFYEEWAFICNMWERIGYEINKCNKMVILRGDIPNKGFFEYKGNKLILSSFQIEKNIEDYINLIQQYNPDFIQAYPSSIILIANHINKNGIRLKMDKLKSIICGSENISDIQKKEIELAFNVRVYSFYGHTEHSCIGGECEVCSDYHLNSEYGYTEILDERGNEIDEEGVIGELVVTGFNNYVVPFIRYRTSDMAEISKGICKCGRHYKRIKKINGRKQEYFINSKGEKVIFTWADYPLWECKDIIWAYQYIQNTPGQVILNINFKENYSEYNVENIKKVFKEYYNDINIEINKVSKIDRTKRGKFKYLIQNLKI